MLFKNPQRKTNWTKNVLIGTFALECGIFIGTYWLYDKTHRERNFRNHLRLNYPKTLEFYYKTVEFIDSKSTIREVDRRLWEKEGFVGLGSALYMITAPSEEVINNRKNNYTGLEKDPKAVTNKNQQFFNVLQAAANSDKPLHLLTKKEIEEKIIKKHN